MSPNRRYTLEQVYRLAVRYFATELACFQPPEEFTFRVKDGRVQLAIGTRSMPIKTDTIWIELGHNEDEHTLYYWWGNYPMNVELFENFCHLKEPFCFLADDDEVKPLSKEMRSLVTFVFLWCGKEDCMWSQRFEKGLGYLAGAMKKVHAGQTGANVK